MGSLSACPSPEDPDLPGLRRHDPGEEGRTGTVVRVGAWFDPTHPFEVDFGAAGGGADFYTASELVLLDE